MVVLVCIFFLLYIYIYRYIFKKNFVMPSVLRSQGTYDKKIVWSVRLEIREYSLEHDGVEVLYSDQYSLVELASFSDVSGIYIYSYSLFCY